jgi:hypothetical protein
MLTPTLCLWTAIALTSADTPAPTPWWDASVENSLQRAPKGPSRNKFQVSLWPYQFSSSGRRGLMV